MGGKTHVWARNFRDFRQPQGFENTAKLADDIFDGYKKPVNWSDDFHDKVRKVLDEPQAKQLAVDMKHHKTLKAAIKADPKLIDKYKLASTHKLPEGWRTDTDFLKKLRNVWEYKGSKIPNGNMQPTQLTRVDPGVAKQLRIQFGKANGPRELFRKHLGEDPNIANILRKAGFSQEQIPTLIQKLKDGKGIDNYQVHHKIPLALGGKNNFDNLVLMKNSPFHTTITTYHRLEINPNLGIGQSGTFDFPVINGAFYSPPFID